MALILTIAQLYQKCYYTIAITYNRRKAMIAGSGVLYQSLKTAEYMWLAMEMEERSNWNTGKFISYVAALKAFEIAGDICTEENGLLKN